MVEMDRNSLEKMTQERSEQDGNGATDEGGNDDDVAIDRPEITDGSKNTPASHAVMAAEEGNCAEELTILLTDP